MSNSKLDCKSIDKIINTVRVNLTNITDDRINIKELYLYMSKHRQAAKVDSNQNEIIRALEKIPGLKVAKGHDDIIVGYKGFNFWFEIKNPETSLRKNGDLNKNALRDSQRELKDSWPGQYGIISSYSEAILYINTTLLFFGVDGTIQDF